LVNEGYLRKFILNPGLPSEVRAQRQPQAPADHLGSTLVQCREVNAIFDNSPIEDTTTKERTIYVNEACRDSHPAIVTRTLRPQWASLFSEEHSYAIHFLHNNALVVTVQIECCKVSKIQVGEGSSANILYGHALD